MNSKKTIIILFLSFCFTLELIAQNCGRTYYKGTMINVTENNTIKICFKMDPAPDSIADVYHSKYTILGAGGTEIYTIHFYFYKPLDSISILYINTITGKDARKEIRFDEHSSVRFFKNYVANDTRIDENDQFCTLFSIPDPSHPYIVLNRFQCIDDPNIYLSLESINSEKLQQHFLDVEVYKKWKDSVNIVAENKRQLAAERKREINTFLNDMKEYKEGVIKNIKWEDEEVKIHGSPFMADPEYLNQFKNKLDQLFISYYKNIFTCKEFDGEVGFTFICTAEGKIDSLKTIIYPINSPRITWFEDSFKVNIAPLVANDNYQSSTTRRFSPNLKSDFDLRFLKPFDQLKPTNAEFEEFRDVKKEIYNEFESYYVRSFKVPTKYSYSIKYRSTVEYAEWLYEINRKGVEKIGPKGSTQTIPENLINIFKTKIAKPKVGKYLVKICTIYINDKPVGQDIQSN